LCRKNFHDQVDLSDFSGVFRKRHKRHCGVSWRIVYQIERAVDKEGTTVDFMLSEKRDEPAARAFFVKAMVLPFFNDL